MGIDYKIAFEVTFENFYENCEVGKQYVARTEITYRLFAREYTFVKYYLPRTIARWSLIISRQIIACKNNDTAITMESTHIDVTRRIGWWINRWYALTGRVSTCRTFQTTSTKRLPWTVIGDKRRRVKIYIHCNRRTKGENSSCQSLSSLNFTLSARKTQTLKYRIYYTTTNSMYRNLCKIDL